MEYETCLMLFFYNQVAKEELSRECDYELEATNQKRFRDLISNKQGFYVPLVVDDISSKRVLTTELVTGGHRCHQIIMFLNLCDMI